MPDWFQGVDFSADIAAPIEMPSTPEASAEDPAEFDHRKCYEQLGQFKKGLNLGHYICGICIKACNPPAISKGKLLGTAGMRTV